MEWDIWRACLFLKKTPKEIDDSFTYVELLKFNELLDREDDIKMYQAGIQYFDQKNRKRNS